uniref:Uncharacterized protein n=1 Tax=mine drainage metagenome TaxID=410659 RepID=E6PDH6_9ZZZZ
MTILRALFFAAVAAAIAQSFAALALTLARTESLHAARAAARDALGAAPVTVQQIVASRIALGSDPLAAIAPVVSCASLGALPCALRTTTSVALRPSGAGAILQNNAIVAEARIDVSLRSVVTDSAGSAVVVAHRLALLRTFAEPPYASYEGDAESAGIAPSSLTAGTLVNVIYRNAKSGASIPGNVWSTAPAAQPSLTPWPQ